MPTVVVPFRAESAKRRLAPAPETVRAALAQAMLEDVVAACEAVGPTVIAGGGAGQGVDVERALRTLAPGPVLVVNADVPCVQPRDLLALLGAMPERGIALVPAADGTSNALALADSHLFAPLYGRGSAERFRANAESRRVPFAEAEIPNLADDVDTLDDLERLEGRLGPRTAGALEELRAGLAR